MVAPPRPRFADDQRAPGPRRGCEAGPALPSPGSSDRCRNTGEGYRRGASTSPPRRGLHGGGGSCRRAFRRGLSGDGAMQQGDRALATHHGVGLSRPSRQARRLRLEAPAAKSPPLEAAILNRSRPSWHRLMAGGTVHIVGAGLAGLSAAVGLVGARREIVVHELARHAGGRCRSYFEPALGLTIDNGNHLLLSANRAALAFLKTVGSQGKLVGPDHAEFAFADLASGERWSLRPNDGPVPWWILSKS